MKHEQRFGHPKVLRNTGKNCLTCRLEQDARRRRERGAVPRDTNPEAHVKKYGHEKQCRPNRSDCAICHRKQARVRAANSPGPHRAFDTVNFPCGHSRELARPGNKGCSVCHRVKERSRYQTKPEYYRTKAAARLARYKTEWPEKITARSMVNHAVQSGRLVRLPCESCGDVKSQGHHDDYAKPLDVHWLCPPHHAA